MDIKQVTYFVVVAEQGNLSTASKTLSVTQPTLTVALQKLESEFGVKLLYYSSRKMRLTNEGKQFYKYATEFIRSYNRLMESTWNINKEVTGTVTVAAAPIMSRIYLGDLINSFHEKYPSVSIRIEGKWGADGLDRLESQNVDFALKKLPVDETKYDTIPVANQELRLGVHKDHPLAKRRKVSFHELSGETFLTLSDNYSLHKQFLKNCERAGFTPRIGLSSSDCDFLANMVSRNWGIFMTAQPIWDAVDCRNIRLLDVYDADVSWNLVLVSKKDHVMSNAGIAFAQLAEQVFRPHTHQ